MILVFKSFIQWLLPNEKGLIKRCTGGVVLLVCIAFISCNSSTPVKKENEAAAKPGTFNLPAPPAIAPAEKERIQRGAAAWYDSVLLAKNFNGGMIVAKKGNIVFETYHGTVHLPGSDVITATTPLHIASVSKTFTAMAVLKMAQDGKLSLDDELVKYFPEFNYPGVTVKTLLNHRSGLPNYTHFLERMGWDKKVNASNKDMLDFMIAHKAEMENIGTPGTRFSYCNTNFALLALLVEKISGKPYPQYMQETIFEPLQMKHTFVYTPADSGKVAPSYDWKGRLADFTFLDNIYGDKNIYSTPGDLLLWDKLLQTDQFLKPATLALAYEPYSNEKPGTHNYGLGWRMNIYPNGKKIIYHNGWWHGNNTSFVRLLQDSATIIVIGNKFNSSIYHTKELANLFGEYGFQEEEEETAPAKVPDAKSLFMERKATAPKKVAAIKKVPAPKKTTTTKKATVPKKVTASKKKA